MKDIERRLLIEQTKKEVLDDIGKYQVGFAIGGEIVASKTSAWQGYIFVIPSEKYEELFKGG